MDDITRRTIRPNHAAATSSPSIVAFGVSECGPVRTSNEDAFAIDLDLGLFIVADGMGGHAAGEIASRLAVETIAAFVARSNEDKDSDATSVIAMDDSMSPEANCLRTALEVANRRIYRAGASNENYQGMGTTVVAVLFGPSTIVVAHAGDSRVYQQHDGRLVRLTRDDSLVELLGTPDEASDPEAYQVHQAHRNIVTNVLGGEEEITVHVSEVPRTSGMRLMLCSDGVHGVLDDGRIGGILASHDPPRQHAERLVSEAIAAGGRDNATALVVAYGEAV